MPCGGIIPAPAFNGPGGIEHAGPCWMCKQYGCELAVIEWDSYVHERCLDSFMVTSEGACILEHEHEVMTTKGPWDPVNAYVAATLVLRETKSALYEIQRRMTPEQTARAEAMLEPHGGLAL